MSRGARFVGCGCRRRGRCCASELREREIIRVVERNLKLCKCWFIHGAAPRPATGFSACFRLFFSPVPARAPSLRVCVRVSVCLAFARKSFYLFVESSARNAIDPLFTAA